MSRYIDADKIEYYRDCDECHEECQLGCTEPFVIAYRAEIDDIPTADVIERSKIDKAIAEIKELYIEWENTTDDARLETNPFGAVLNIIQRNIGE